MIVQHLRVAQFIKKHGHTSCGQVGRGGNARFHSFRLVLSNGPTNQRTDGWTDKASYRVACPQLKKRMADEFCRFKMQKVFSVCSLILSV